MGHKADVIGLGMAILNKGINIVSDKWQGKYWLSERLLNYQGRLCSLWASRIYYNFSQVSFIFPSFRHPWHCITKPALRVEANDRNKSAEGNSSKDVTFETNKTRKLALEPSR